VTIYPPFREPVLLVAMQANGSLLMNADQYLFAILHRETVHTSVAQAVLNTLRPIIVPWANQYLAGIAPSGSFAKGTAIKSGTDIDLFISLKPETRETLREIYHSLRRSMQDAGLSPNVQNVSINVRAGGYSVDLVPGKRQNTLSTDHSLYRRRQDTWAQTNVLKHIQHVRNANRLRETRIIKLWRNQKGLDFPSFYLELAVIAALSGTRSDNLSGNVLKVLEYLRDTFVNARFIDPANTNNIISDDLNMAERAAIQRAATVALGRTWGDLVS
jgi:Nucleotidyltransferase domain